MDLFPWTVLLVWSRRLKVGLRHDVVEDTASISRLETSHESAWSLNCKASSWTQISSSEYMPY